MQNSQVTYSQFEKIKNSGFLKIIFYIKNHFLGITNPYYKKYTSLNKIQRKLKKNNSCKKFIDQDNTFSKEFAESLLELYSFIKPFNEMIDWSFIFEKQHFTVFLLQHFSTVKQKNLLNKILQEDYLNDMLKQKGFKNSLKDMSNFFEDYKQSFSKEQIEKINHILNQATHFHTFLNCNIEKLLEQFVYIDINNDFIIKSSVKVEDSLEELNKLAEYLSLIHSKEDYFYFFKLYSLFLKETIISKKDFNKFTKIVDKLNYNDFLLNVLQYESQNEVLQTSTPIQVFEKPTVSGGVKILEKYMKKSCANIFHDDIVKEQYLIIKKMFGTNRAGEVLIKIKKYSINNTKKTHIMLMITTESFYHYIIKPLSANFFDKLFANILFVDDAFKEKLFRTQSEMNSIFEKNNDMIRVVAQFLSSSGKNNLQLVKIYEFASYVKEALLESLKEWQEILFTIEESIKQDQYDSEKFSQQYESMTFFIERLEQSRALFTLFQEYLEIYL